MRLIERIRLALEGSSVNPFKGLPQSVAVQDVLAWFDHLNQEYPGNKWSKSHEPENRWIKENGTKAHVWYHPFRGNHLYLTVDNLDSRTGDETWFVDYKMRGRKFVLYADHRESSVFPKPKFLTERDIAKVVADMDAGMERERADGWYTGPDIRTFGWMLPKYRKRIFAR